MRSVNRSVAAQGRNLLIALPVLLAVIGSGMGRAGAVDRTVSDGVYAARQAERGKTVYAQRCAVCHGVDLDGGVDTEDASRVPALRRANFGVTRRTLENLYGFVRESMPRDEPGALADRVYADLIAYILQQNGFPAGADDLPTEGAALRAIAIVGAR